MKTRSPWMIKTVPLIAVLWSPLAAQASEPITLSLSGYSKWWVVGAWPSQKYQQATHSDFNSVDIKGDNEIHFKGLTQLDNGLQIGVKIELEAGGHTDQSTDPIDKSYVWVQGGFGKFQLGTDYNAASLLHISAPDAAGLWNGPPMGVMSDYVIHRPSAVSTMYSGNQTELDPDDNADKISYFTPAWNGLTLGVSYVPTANSEDDRGPTQKSPLYALGLGYENTFGPVEVGLSLGYTEGDMQVDSASSPQARFRAYSVGSQLTYAGITLAASYGNERNKYHGSLLAADATDNTGHAFDIGIQYADGPYKISMAHYQSWVNGLYSDPGRDHITINQISGKYTLSPGVAVMGSLGHIRYDDEAGSANPTNNNRGLALMTGLGLWF